MVVVNVVLIIKKNYLGCVRGEWNKGLSPQLNSFYINACTYFYLTLIFLQAIFIKTIGKIFDLNLDFDDFYPSVECFINTSLKFLWKIQCVWVDATTVNGAKKNSYMILSSPSHQLLPRHTAVSQMSMTCMCFPRQFSAISLTSNLVWFYNKKKSVNWDEVNFRLPKPRWVEQLYVVIVSNSIPCKRSIYSRRADWSNDIKLKLWWVLQIF